jgi:hypothetical protein
MCGFVVSFARYDPLVIRRVFSWAIRPTAELTLLHVGPQLSGSALFTQVGMGKAGHPFKVHPTCSAAT